MAAGGINGPLPKPGARHPENTLGMKVVRTDGIRRGPALPDDRIWCEKTLEWYEQWRVSPLAQLFTDQDWDVLQTAANLHDRLWDSSNILKPNEAAVLSKEIDRKTANLGATYGDRLRLRIHIDDKPESEFEDDGFQEDLDDPYYEDLLS